MTAAKLDPALCRKLAEQCREDNERMTSAPWTTPAGTHDVPDVGRALADNAFCIARTRNNLPAIADQLTAAAEMAEAMDAPRSDLTNGELRGYADDPHWPIRELAREALAHRLRPALTADEVRAVVREAAIVEIRADPDAGLPFPLADAIATRVAEKLTCLMGTS